MDVSQTPNFATPRDATQVSSDAGDEQVELSRATTGDRRTDFDSEAGQGSVEDAARKRTGARILITDDRPDFAAFVTRTLRSFDCEFASSVQQAREMLAGGTFDLLFCDIYSGDGAARALAHEVTKGSLDTAVVLFTDADDPELASSAFEFGAYGYLVKPPLPGHLLMTTMNALRRRELEIAHREHAQNLEDRAQAVIDHAPMPIYAKDASGCYVLSNAIADEMAGVEQGSMLGQTDESIMSPESAGKSLEIDRGVLADGSLYEAREVLVVDGVPRTFKTVKFPLLNEEGGIDAVGGISADITGELEAAGLRDELVATQRRSIEELKRSSQETVERLTRAIDRRDSSTGAHVTRMAAIAAFLGTEIGLDTGRVELLRAAAPMHDVGKIGTPDQILRKPGPLTPEERSVMETHTLVGHEILADSKSELLRVAATIALTHHERYDGSGYPRGLAGEAIPIEGRLTAVADVFDALLSDRSYRPAMTIEETVAVITEGRGTHFDPRIADVLCDHLDEVIAVRDCPEAAGSGSRLRPADVPDRGCRLDDITGRTEGSHDGIGEIHGSDVVSAETFSTGGNRDKRGSDRAVEAISRSYGDALRAADGAAAERLAFEALHEGISVATLYERVIAPAMWRIGSLWEEGAITVADEHLATALTHRVMAGVFGSNFGHAASRPGRVLLAAVEGQHHALGLRMAADVLELAGYEVIYLGGDVPLDALVATVESRRPDLVGLSSTLSPDKSSIGRSVSQLHVLTPDLPILVGGQGVPDSVLSEDQVIPAPALEEVVVLVQSLLADQPGSLIGEQPGPSTPPDPPFVVDAGGGSPEDRLLGAATDSADLARTHARMAHSYRQLAYADSITKGPNRRAFDDRLALLNDSPEAAPVAVLMLDLDGFKHANDTLGHAAGDVVLREVYDAIESCLREADFAARLGGDEFALLLPKAETAEAEEIAERVLVAIRKAGNEASVTATIGIAPLAGDPRHTMLEADLALYAGKAAGGDQIGVKGHS